VIDARLVFQLTDRSGEINGERRSLNDRHLLLIEKSMANPASPAS
jgi:hypothetical protein